MTFPQNVAISCVDFMAYCRSGKNNWNKSINQMEPKEVTVIGNTLSFLCRSISMLVK